MSTSRRSIHDLVQVNVRRAGKWERNTQPHGRIIASGMKRLMEDPNAILAWEKIEADIPEIGHREYLVGAIVNLAASAWSRPEDRLTQAELDKNAKRAAELAEELVCLIQSDPWLHRYIGIEQFMPSEMVDAMWDLSYYDDDPSHPDPDMQDRLEDAGSIMKKYIDDPGSFLVEILNLNGFAKRQRSLEPRPMAPNPGTKSTDHRRFAIQLCELFVAVHQRPSHDIVAGLTGALFDEIVDTHKVKLWWARRTK